MKQLLVAAVCTGFMFSCVTTKKENTDQNPLKESKAEVVKEEKKKLDIDIASKSAVYKLPKNVKSQTVVDADIIREISLKESKPKFGPLLEIYYPTTSFLNVRSGAGVSHSVVRAAKFGEEMKFTGIKKADWMQNEKGNWVYALYLSKTKPANPSDPKVDPVAVSNVAGS